LHTLAIIVNLLFHEHLTIHIMQQITFRKASERDIPLVLYFLNQWARSSREDRQPMANEQMVQEHLVDRPGHMEIIFVIRAGEEVGFAQYTRRFSFMQGHYTMLIQQLFVLPAHREKGIGKALFGHLLQYAQSHDCNRIEWQANESCCHSPYYQAIGAKYKEHEKVFYLQMQSEDNLRQKQHT
jgi:GNAT superfamily N-acetyltransferase